MKLSTVVIAVLAALADVAVADSVMKWRGLLGTRGMPTAGTDE